MRDIKEDEIRSEFGERTFSRGLDYFESRYVRMGVKKGDSLIGTVQGSAPHPYRVNIEIGDHIQAECTCPVGNMCKHGVALLLQWIHDKDFFTDGDHILGLLREKSKEELIKIITTMLEKEPALASKLVFSGHFREKKINVETLSREIRHICRDLDYYAIPGVVEELEEIKGRGDNLREEGHVADALEVYLLLIEWGVEAFEEGVDDSDGELGDVLIACVEDFGEVAKNLGEEQKKEMLHRILKIVEVEDYGLETEEMLFSIATRETITFIEEELLKRIPTTGEQFHIDYYRKKALNLMIELYGRLDMPEDVLKVIKKVGIENEQDYVRIVKVLAEKSQYEEAFCYVKEGLHRKIGIYVLGNLYFTILHQGLLKEKRGDIAVNVEEMVTTAVQALSSFNPERYSIIKEIFEKMRMHEELISVLKKKCTDDVVIEVLLYENRIDEALDHALSSSGSSTDTLMKAARAAKEKGNERAAVILTYNVLKKGLYHPSEDEIELIELFVRKSDEKELKEAIDTLQNVFIARLFASTLLERNQEYAVVLLKRFMPYIGKEEIKGYALNMESRYGGEICRFWISMFANRSYAHYDDIIDILKILKRITEKKEWDKYISAFVKDNKGKKKLLEKIRTLEEKNRSV